MIRFIKILTVLVTGQIFGFSAHAAQMEFQPRIFWESGMDKGAILASPVELLLVDSKGVKYGRVSVKGSVDGVYLSPDGKKLVYTSDSKVWLVKIETGETRLVTEGWCGYLRWNSDSSSFMFIITENKVADSVSVVAIKFFWADGDGKNLKQVYP